MSELVEDDIMGEDLDYEEYDLDEEEEEALLAENEGQNILIKMEPMQISVRPDESLYSQESLSRSVDYHHLDEEDDAIIEEEEDDDDCDSKSRDRFKSERTKVSLIEPSKSRNIPDSLDDVKTTEIVPQSQKRGFNKRGRFLKGRNRNFNNRGRMQNQQNYRSFQNFGNWEGPPLMSMPPQPQIRPPYHQMMDMYHHHQLHGPPINMPPVPYGQNMMMHGQRDPYMMNDPQIPRTSLKRSYNEMNTNNRPKIARKVNSSPKENNKQQSVQNRLRISNPNLTVINTVDITPKIQPIVKKVETASNNKPAAKALAPEEAEYEKKVQEQKRKREEILAKKEMRRKEEATKKAQLTAPVVTKTQQKIRKTKESMQRKALRMRLLEGFHGESKESEDSNFAVRQRPYPDNHRNDSMMGNQHENFTLRNLVSPSANNAPYNPLVNTSVPPPRIAQPLQTFQSQQVVSRPPGIPPYISPPGLPPPHTRPLYPQQQQLVQRDFYPNRPPPMSVSQPTFPQPGFNQSGLAPNIPPPQYNPSVPQISPQAPTITLNFPPPPLNRTLPPEPSKYYQEQGLLSYEDIGYNNQVISLSRSNISPIEKSSQMQTGSYSEKYKWKNQQDKLRNVSTGSNITIQTSNQYKSQPVKKVKRFKRIIRKKKNGDILLIKKIVLDDNGISTGEEKIEFIHDDLLAEQMTLKKAAAEKTKKAELAQQKSKISNKHFRGADFTPINRIGEGIRKTTYSKLSASKPVKRLVTTITKGRPIRPVRCSSSTVMLSRIPSNVTVNELKDLTDDEGLEPAKSILYDKAERKCSFEFAKQSVAFNFCKKMNGRMLKMSIIHADIV